MVPQESDLEIPLQTVPIDCITKRRIASELWNFDITDSSNLEKNRAFDQYFRYYTEQSDLALYDRGRHTSARTHRDIVGICGDIQQGISRVDVKCRLSSRVSSTQLGVDDAVLDASIDLAARLLLMLEIGSVKYGFSGHKTLRWHDGSLQSFVANHFDPPRALSLEHVKLEKIFIARNLKRIARISIVWTDNLADHLRMLEHDTQVAIFHHASFLQMTRESTMFPEGLIAETERTLALLFPQQDPKTGQWFKKQAFQSRLDINAINCGQLRAEDRQINAFIFWRDRLVILKQLFDESDSEPSTWSQWWYDRRKGVPRYPFLLTAMALALTLLFGLIQCLEGALQVYKAYHPS